MPTYSDWVTPPVTDVIMTGGDARRWADSDPATAEDVVVLIRDGRGLDTPRGRYEWTGALGGPMPQHEGNAWILGWDGICNWQGGPHYFNDPDEASYVGLPGDHWPGPPLADAGGGDPDGVFFYGYDWSTSIVGNGWLTAQWQGTMMAFSYYETIDNAGPLGTGPDPSHDPNDPMYAGLFPPGADYIEFEGTSCIVLGLKASANESRYEPLTAYLDGDHRDGTGADWSVIYQLGDSFQGWQYYMPPGGNNPLLCTAEEGPYEYGDDHWGLVTNDYLSLPVQGDEQWHDLDLTTIVANNFFFFFVVPFAVADRGVYPLLGYPGDNQVTGDADNGVWSRYRPAPRFALKAHVQPTRIRARYPDGTPVGSITGAITDLRARFS